MKLATRPAPSTIRHRVGSLARCLDWYGGDGRLAINALRQLPKHYARYSPADGEKREDVERDRRLDSGEEERIRRVLARGSFHPFLTLGEKTVGPMIFPIQTAKASAKTFYENQEMDPGWVSQIQDRLLLPLECAYC